MPVLAPISTPHPNAGILQVPDSIEDALVKGAFCEVQISNVAAHIFNEIEHDIEFKRKKATPTPQTREALEKIRTLCRDLEDAATDAFKRHARDVQNQHLEVIDAEDLRGILQAATGLELGGDFRALFGLLRSAVNPFTVHAIELAAGGSIRDLLMMERQRAAMGNQNDATVLALALVGKFRVAFGLLAREWAGEASPLIDAVRAATQDAQRQS